MALLVFTPNTTITQSEGGTTYNFNENLSTDTVVGTIRNTTTGLDYRITSQPSGPVRYKLVERTESGNRVLDIVIADGNNINHEQLAVHPVTIQGYSGADRIDAGSFSFRVKDINERPTGVWMNTLNNTEVMLQENRPVDHVIATLGVIDPDRTLAWGQASVTYQVDPTDPRAHLYGIKDIGEPDSPQWALVVKGTIDYDDPALVEKVHILKVIATDGGGLSFPQLLRINLTNDATDDGPPPNNRPTTPSIVNNTVASLTEAASGAVNVATVVSTDDGVGGTTVQYELVNTFGGLFSVNQTTGVISFNGTAQDYESNANLQVENAGTVNERKFFNVQVRAKESGTNGQTSGTTTVKVYLNDVNEAVSDATYAPNAMNENAQQGAVVAAAPTVTDPDTAPVNRDFRYTLVDVNGNAITGPANFAVNATTGVITVGALGLPDVSVPTDVKVYIRIQDRAGAGFSHTEEVTVRVNPFTGPQNQPPQSISLSSGGSVDELAASGKTVATFVTTYSDDTGGFVYTIVNSDGRFEFVGNELRVKDGYRLDHEQFKSHTVTVKVADKNGSGLSHTQNFTIAVNDVSPETTSGSSANDLFYGGSAADLLGGAFGNDTIFGGFGDDTLNGDAGNDSLKGEDGKDKINGGLGDDKLWGGYGNDALTGGAGKDTFVFDGRLGTSTTDRRVNYDTIKDYSVKDDSIWLEGDLFKSNKTLYAKIKKGTELAPKKIESKFFTVGDKAKDRDDYFVCDAKKRVLYYDADGSGSKAAIEMATFTNNKALKNFKFSELFFI